MLARAVESTMQCCNHTVLTLALWREGGEELCAFTRALHRSALTASTRSGAAPLRRPLAAAQRPDASGRI